MEIHFSNKVLEPPYSEKYKEANNKFLEAVEILEKQN
jgi:hypothetical protein